MLFLVCLGVFWLYLNEIKEPYLVSAILAAFFAIFGIVYLSKLPVLIKAFIVVFGLVCFVSAASQSPLQSIVASRATSWLSRKLDMKVSIEKAEFKWVDALTLKNVLVEDIHGRAMFKIDEIDVDFSLKDLDYPRFKLINIDYVLLKKANIHIVAEKEGGLNIDTFIARVNKLIAPKVKSKTPKNVPFTIDEASISDANFIFDDLNKPKFNNGTFEYYHFKLSNLNGNLKKFFVMGDTIKFKAKDLNAIDFHSGLDIKKINTDFFYSAKKMEMKSLYAQIGNSILRDELIFTYAKPSYLSDFNNKVFINAQFKNTKLYTADLAKLAPVLLPYADYYSLTSNFEGFVKDFKMKNAEIRFGNRSEVIGDLAFKNLPNVYLADMDLNLKKAFVDLADVMQYSGKDVYEKNLKKIETISFAGKFKGKYNDFDADGDFKSALGNVAGSLKMSWSGDVKNAKYTGNLMTEGFEIGELIGDRSVEKISISGKIAGEGLDPKTLALNFDGTVPFIGLKGYDYKNIKIDGSLVNAVFNGKFGIKDSNLIMNLNGKININDIQNELDIVGEISKANLFPLGLAKTSIKIKTKFDLDLKGNHVDDLSGTAKFISTTLTNNEKPLLIDSLFTSSYFVGNNRNVKINSEFLDANFNGNFVPTRAFADLARLYGEYELYFLGNKADREAYFQNVYKPYDAKYGIDYNFKLKNIKPLADFVGQDIQVSKSSDFSGRFNIANNIQFSLFGNADSVKIGSAVFYKNELDLNSFSKVSFTDGKATPKFLTSLIFNSDQQLLSSAAPSEQLELSAEWGQGNQIEFFTKIKQQNSKNRARFFGDLYFVDKGFDIKIKADTTKSFVYILNKKWHIDKNNLINIQGAEISFNNVLLSDGLQGIAIDGLLSKDPAKIAKFSIQDFDLRTVKPFLKDFNFEGIVNGQLTLQNLYKSTLVTTDTLTVDEIIYKGEYIGSLVADAHWNASRNKLELAAQVQYKSNPVPFLRLSGSYDPQNIKDQLNLQTNFKNAQLVLARPFLNAIFNGFEGDFSGKVDIEGTLSDPTFDGDIVFRKGKLGINTINTVLNFDNQRLYFDDDRKMILFKNFKVTDNAKNEAFLNDGINYFKGGKVNMNITSRLNNFKILETTAKDIESFYGNGFATGTLDVLGPPDNLLFKARLTSNKGTYLVIPLDGATTVNKSDPFIEFVDHRKPVALETKKEINLSGMRLDFSFNFTPDAGMEIIVDSKTNDKMFCRGKADDFKVIYDTRGVFTLNGKYVITDGYYDFKFQSIASKKFMVSPGSAINWSGNPLDGLIDITAIYEDKVKVNSIIQGLQDANVRYPVMVSIAMKNRLTKPDIALGLKFKEYPVQNRDDVLAFENRMQVDEQERNRNIASVLILHQLFPKDPNAGFYSDLIIGNMSEILSNKINDFAAKIDKNLDIGLSVQQVGQNLLDNLNFSVGYKINDRLKFSGNGNMNGSVSNSFNANRNLYYGGELEYILTEDGTWKFKVFSRNLPPNYAGFDRNVMTNGFSFQSSRNFNRLLKPKKIEAIKRKEEQIEGSDED